MPDTADATGDAPPPLILTLRLDEAAFARLDALRRMHFPPARNHLRAHLTLFHALPGGREAEVVAALAEACAATPPLALAVSGLFPLGRGVAFDVDGEGLRPLRAALAARFRPWLTPQDATGGWRPHVTVQNKADPAEARALLARLRAAFAPWTATGEGLLLHRYLGGPWEAVGTFPFRAGRREGAAGPSPGRGSADAALDRGEAGSIRI